MNGSGSSAPANNAVPQNTLQPGGGITSSEYTNYQEIESGDIAAMTDSSSVELLAEFDSKKKKWRTWPWTACLCIGLFIWSANVLSGEAVWLILALGAIAIYLAYNYDQVNKSVVLFYDMEPDFERAYEDLHASFDLLKASHKSWHVNSGGPDRRFNNNRQIPICQYEDMNLISKAPASRESHQGDE